MDRGRLACNPVRRIFFLPCPSSDYSKRFNPIFLLPVPESLPQTQSASGASTPVIHTPGRRTGTGSANIQIPAKVATPRIPVSKFVQLSLLSMVFKVGLVPPYGVPISGTNVATLEEIRRKASKPIVVFPECTTSNGRGLLRFSDVFRQTVPVKDYNVFVMSVR